MALPGQSARAETINCTRITSLPTAISTQGVFCLTQDLSTAITNGNAITINANNVTIDCNDWKVGGLAGGPATIARGIYANNRKNITIRNCGIRGFRVGILLEGNDAAYHLVENNRIDLSTQRGMFIWGDGATVRGNRVFDSGGGTTDWEGQGITVGGDGVSILDNTVSGVDSIYYGSIGIYVSSERTSFVAGNRITGLSYSGPGTGRFLGIVSYGPMILHNNMVALDRTSAPADRGISCSGDSIAKSNMVRGFGPSGIPIASCLSDGNTTLQPEPHEDCPGPPVAARRKRGDTRPGTGPHTGRENAEGRHRCGASTGCLG